LNEENENYLIQNSFLQNKRLISISPGGFKGFYLFGILSFIKENYDLQDFIYSGASAGSWNALFMCLKRDNDSYLKILMMDEELKKTATIFDFEKKMKSKLLLHYKDKDANFDFRRLFIGVTTINEKYQLTTTIYNDFENLEDAIHCCIASSHIPFITGGMMNQYNGRMNFDGGFKKNPYLNINKSVLHVSPSMWIKIKESMKKENGIPVKSNPSFFRTIQNFLNQTTLFKKDDIDFSQLYQDGYNDAKENKTILDDIFIYQNYSTNYYYT
jgi:predicted acylesterase/phospholipase RssA